MFEAKQEVPEKEFPEFTREQLQKYARASGDHNEIHLDDEAAKKEGLPGVIVHGMLSAALMAERALGFAEENDPSHSWKVSHFQARFKGMCFPGDRLSIGGFVKETQDNEIAVTLKAKNQKGEVTTSSQIRLKRID